MIERETRVAVGQMSFKHPPDASGVVELGHGVSPSYQNRGYATEMAEKLVVWGVTHPKVRSVSAECREDNWASIRVLERVGFRPVSQRMADEGPLIVWAYMSERHEAS
jgi:[ribosomal protein S5]-alanine N-acetyltransferase